MGSSYCLPVRLSIIVSVSAIVFVVGIGRFELRDASGRTRNAVRPFGPACLILLLAPLTAEGTPARLDRTPAAQHAQQGSIHPTNDSAPLRNGISHSIAGGARASAYAPRVPGRHRNGSGAARLSCAERMRSISDYG